ncbi:succinate dehydrogenase, hydrophobic membrane anchor protein [Candidatus Liberibacter sp.]|uniref:succinate dehydrogenase, hydrophobic membrane anchor protein n=1 Tax=Candidatus Liberibacter sp. TaxID=34022 RepID=UPI0015F6F7AA|nr:succinate dehydrogenase, hydrophobic membrane anchor protein [Candidatus Liberibacter sp.]MBA5724164.1 succinate dehydrogenase, hydrophobic membrane anchor protein [Candidatus Liberibacter sp.]
MDMRSNLGQIRGLGSAKGGTKHFLRQRITAIANIPFVVFSIAFLVIYSSAPYEDVISALSNPFVLSIIGIGIFSVFVHMRLGMQTIIEDYIHSRFLKIIFLFSNTLFVFFFAAVCLFSLLKIVTLV